MTQTEFENRFISARRRAIGAKFSRLNDMQREAVLTTEGPLLLLAGAGSGKTTVLINRIANLLEFGRGSDCNEIPENVTEADIEFLESCAENPQTADAGRLRSLCAVEPAQPWQVIAITFTNKAADELKSRLEAMLGPEANDVWAMTFHSACVRILRRNIERLGYAPGFTIYDTTDSNSIMKRILKELDLDEKTYPPKTVLNYISRAKDAMVTPRQFAASAGGDIRKKNIAAAYSAYEKRLKDANAVDFDDLILLTVRLLMEFDDVRDYYQRKFRYVLIDEYQDTNNLQYLLASNLAGGYENICVVGDDDQSIYKFRGATIENILNFENRYKGARTIRLEQNYRSTGNILAAANAVIRNNLGRKGKELWTDSSSGDKITLYSAQNEYEEAQYVAAQIFAGHSTGANWRDNAILYRMNAQSNQFEREFQRNGIPYRIIGGTRFFDRAEVKDMVAYLCVINNPNDDLRLTRIINNPPRGIGAATVERLRQTAAENAVSIYDVIKRSGDIPELRASAGKLHLFLNLIEDMRDMEKTARLDEFYDALIEKTGYVKALSEKDTDENRNRIENVNELKTNIISYLKENGDEAPLSGFLDEISLYTDIEQYDQSDDSVIMMTMHSAKGLEFPTVFIVGAEEGMFPGVRVIGDPEEMEEERRLCYVAITRAKKKLYLTCARQRMLFGRTSSNLPSRFIGEIPEEYMEKIESRPSGYSSYGLHGKSGGQHREGGFQSERRSAFSYSGRKTGPGYDYSQPPKKKYSVASAPRPSASDITGFKNGDAVEHEAFGPGVIISLQAMGGDALIEIAFEKSGTKRLMLKAAAKHMKKA